MHFFTQFIALLPVFTQAECIQHWSNHRQHLHLIIIMMPFFQHLQPISVTINAVMLEVIPLHIILGTSSVKAGAPAALPAFPACQGMGKLRIVRALGEHHRDNRNHHCVLWFYHCEQWSMSLPWGSVVRCYERLMPSPADMEKIWNLSVCSWRCFCTATEIHIHTVLPTHPIHLADMDGFSAKKSHISTHT